MTLTSSDMQKIERAVAEAEKGISGEIVVVVAPAHPWAQRRKSVEAEELAGTRLVREWNGVEHTVTILADGFEWQGRKYKSLSAIARDITGTRWNGYRYFGLRERKQEHV